MQLRPLRELADQIRGVTYAKEDASSSPTPGAVGVLRAGNIQESELTIDDLVYVPRARVSDSQFVHRHDILIASSSGSLDVVGKAAQANRDLGVAFGAFCKVLRPRPEINARYLAHFFRTPGYRRSIAKLAAGANINNLRNEHLDGLMVPVPSAEDQRSIADRLDSIDGICRKRRKTIALTQQLICSVFWEMFGDPVTNPKRWKEAPLTALGRITTGNTPSRAVPEYFGDDIEWIKSDNINTPSHYLTRATEGLSVRGRAVGRTAPSGSTLMTCIAGSPDCIGNVGLADREVAFNQQINAVTPHQGVDHRFLYVLLLVGKRLVQAASTNSMKGMVSKGKLAEIRVPSPPLEAQRKFGETFESVLRMSQREEVALLDSKLLFDGMLHGAFSGELNSMEGQC